MNTLIKRQTATVTARPDINIHKLKKRTCL